MVGHAAAVSRTGHWLQILLLTPDPRFEEPVQNVFTPFVLLPAVRGGAVEAQAEVSTLTVLTRCPTHLSTIHSDDQQVFVAFLSGRPQPAKTARD